MPIRPITNMPPWGARRVAPNASESEAVIAEPTIIGGMTRIGSAAANGIAPSVMKEAPITQLACPARRSAGVNSLPRTAVASARASGGVMPAAITAAIGPKPPGEARYGEGVGRLVHRTPMSKAIMQPRMMPSRIEFAPSRLPSQFSSPVVRAAMGWPRTVIISAPTTRHPTSG